MKSLLSLCTAFAVMMVSHRAMVYGQVTYNSEGGIVLPNNRMATGPGGAVSYNSEGGIVLPHHMAAADSGYVEMPYHMNKGGSGGGDASSKIRQQGVTYTSEGGIVLPNKLAMATNNNNNNGGGGVSYTSEGGIILPNKLSMAASNNNNNNNNGGGISYTSEGGIILPNHLAADSGYVDMPEYMNHMATTDSGYVEMPYHMNKGGSSHNNSTNDSNKLRQATDNNNSSGGGITYNSEGGIVLPNSLAQQEQTDANGYNQGTGTFYDVEARVPICGKMRSNQEMVVALSAAQMGDDRSKKNPNCGKKMDIIGPSGQQVQAEVIDFCMTCDNDGLDMSPAVFEKVADFSTQSTNIKWKFA
ncbi:hypothetical protein BDA99DRAFT_536058 [Phascolomyces articulosus]|uniref:Uncharacterized protein n=1 Tax=Phascolomyces articulosus TaxID=60185 RepID=A0AAD5K2R0_9FUNG|nr:hypothetical protein BDA99DRAFT_536058 [Phascolomyces articulosus]